MPLALRKLFVARPANSTLRAQFLIAQAAVVTWHSARARLPGLKGLFWRGPLDERLAVFVAKVHSPREVSENLHIGPCFARRIDCLVRDVDGAIEVRERADLFAPD